MLDENIRNLRKAKGLSQEELAVKLNVVRQTVSKWEKGLSVPDSSLLVSLAQELDTSVATLLGDPVQEVSPDDGKVLSERLEAINLQFAKRSRAARRAVRWVLIAVCVVILLLYLALVLMNGSYLNWNYENTEMAIAGTLLHGFEFLFVRLAPVVLLGAALGIAFTYKGR